PPRPPPPPGAGRPPPPPRGGGGGGGGGGAPAGGGGGGGGGGGAPPGPRRSARTGGRRRAVRSRAGAASLSGVLHGPRVLVRVIALPVVPRDHGVRDHAKHDPIGLPQRPREPLATLRISIPDRDPLEPVLTVLCPNLRDSSSEDRSVRPVLTRDADRHRGSRGHVRPGPARLEPGREVEDSVFVHVPERAHARAPVLAHGGEVHQTRRCQELLELVRRERHRAVTSPRAARRSTGRTRW